MATVIGQRELRNDNARIIDAVAAGQSFVVTRHGTPVAELTPVRAARSNRVSRDAVLAAVAGGPRVDAARLRADLDAAVDGGL